MGLTHLLTEDSKPHSETQITFTVFYRFGVFVVAQFIAPLTYSGRRAL